MTDANVCFTDRQLSELERTQRAREQYFQDHFSHIDLEDLTEALACHGTNELIDALRGLLRGEHCEKRFVSATLAAINAMYSDRERSNA